MRRRFSIPIAAFRALARSGRLALCLAGAWILAGSALAGWAQSAPAQTPPSASAAPVVLDSVVAVVNRHVILASDLDDEIRLSVLDPNGAGQTLTRPRALEQLISRTLIEQQIRQEDEEAAMPTPAEVEARLAEISKVLPACVRANCATDAGWKAFLAAHNLTQERVVAYLRYRLEILRFIEQRFRPGIRITQQEIAAYYNDTLLPQYAPGEAVPPLAEVAPRIEEILLQRQVNALFDDWLTNLRKEGDVEVLDPALETAATPGTPATGEGANP
jgi:peptidyl-prolyl cis-trans isomerase SurA